MTTLRTDLLARDVMNPDPICVEPSTSIRRLARVFEENEISGAPVVDQQGRLVGVVSKTDLIRQCMEGTDEIPPAYLFEVLGEQESEEAESSEVIPEPIVCVEDFMTEDPITVPPDATIGRVARLMHEARVHRVVVVEYERYPVGIITSLDLLGAFSQEGKKGK